MLSLDTRPPKIGLDESIPFSTGHQQFDEVISFSRVPFFEVDQRRFSMDEGSSSPMSIERGRSKTFHSSNNYV